MTRRVGAKEPDFCDFLLEGAERMGLSLSADLTQRLFCHWQLLEKWSAKMNLTAIKHSKDAAEKLFLESLLASRLMDGQGTAHDVGSGGGFPGLVIKADCPSRKVILSEAREKKVSFLRQAARQMGLTDGLEIHNVRAGWEKPAIKAEEVISRAVFPPPEWLKIAPCLLEPGGRIWLFSSQSGAEEFDSLLVKKEIEKLLPQGFAIEKIHQYRLPFCGAERQIISLRHVPKLCYFIPA